MAKSYLYKGILAKKRERLDAISKDPSIKEAFEIINTLQTHALIDALFLDCDANPEKGLGAAASNGWQKVAMTLAERHVKGFQYGQNRGRPKKLGHGDAQLFREMEKVRERQKKPNTSAAAKLVAKKLGKKPRAVERDYRRIKKDFEI